MPARRRTVDPELFAKAEFRRASYIAREVWLALITCCADDHGRFEADPLNLLETIFSRAHSATVKNITDALEYWERSGWLLLYDEGKHGFLTGWFEHQYIANPEGSSLPPPPVDIASWDDAKAVKAWYEAKSAARQSNVHFRTACREYEQCKATDPTLSIDLVRTQYGLSMTQVQPEGKGKERKGKEGEIPPPSQSGLKRPDAHMILQNYCRLSEAVRHVYGKQWSQAQQNEFTVDAGAALDEPGCTVSEDDAIAALYGDGKPRPGQKGSWWVGDLCKRRKQCGTSDPTRAAFEADKGKRPSDPFAAAVWDDQLARYRAQQQSVGEGVPE